MSNKYTETLLMKYGGTNGIQCCYQLFGVEGKSVV